MNTPKITRHAAMRCEQMGLTTKAAKHIVRHAETRYPGPTTVEGNTSMIAIWSGQPGYYVAYLDFVDPPRVLTVGYDTGPDRAVRYTRPEV